MATKKTKDKRERKVEMQGGKLVETITIERDVTLVQIETEITNLENDLKQYEDLVEDALDKIAKAKEVRLLILAEDAKKPKI